MTVNASRKNDDDGTEIETMETLTDDEFRQEVVQMLDKLALDVMEGNVDVQKVNTEFLGGGYSNDPFRNPSTKERKMEVIYRE